VAEAHGRVGRNPRRHLRPRRNRKRSRSAPPSSALSRSSRRGCARKRRSRFRETQRHDSPPSLLAPVPQPLRIAANFRAFARSSFLRSRWSAATSEVFPLRDPRRLLIRTSNDKSSVEGLPGLTSGDEVFCVLRAAPRPVVTCFRTVFFDFITRYSVPVPILRPA